MIEFSKQILALLLSVCLVSSSADLAHAAREITAPTSKPLHLLLAPPAKLGRVTDYYDAETRRPDEHRRGDTETRRNGDAFSASPRLPVSASDVLRVSASPRQPLVILIQDLHAHYGVQKNIAGILEYLSQRLDTETRRHGDTEKHQDVSAVSPRLRVSASPRLPFELAVEGAQGPIDSSVMASFPDPSIKRAAADYLMREGELSGAEYFAVMRGLPKALTGVEDMRYYTVNRDLFRQTLADRSRLVQALKDTQAALLPIRSRICSPSVQAIQGAIEAADSGKLSLDRFVTYLASIAREYALPLESGYPHVARYLQNPASLEEAEFMQLTRESADLAYRLKLAKAGSRDEKNLIQVEHDLALLLRVADLRATEEEVRTFGPRLNEFVAMADALLSSDGRKAMGDGRNSEIAPRPSPFALRQLISASLDYYVLAFMRNRPMLDNTLALLGSTPDAETRGHGDTETHQDTSAVSPRLPVSASDVLPVSASPRHRVAVLVAGGFHTAPIAHMLREQKVSYLVITPTVDEISEADHALYVKRLKGDLLSVQEVLTAKMPTSRLDRYAARLRPSRRLIARVWPFGERHGLAIGVAAGGAVLAGAILNASGLPWDQFVSEFSAWAQSPAVAPHLSQVHAALAAAAGTGVAAAMAVPGPSSNLRRLTSLIEELVHHPASSRFKVSFDAYNQIIPGVPGEADENQPAYELSFEKDSNGIVQLDPGHVRVAPAWVLEAIRLHNLKVRAMAPRLMKITVQAMSSDGIEEELDELLMEDVKLLNSILVLGHGWLNSFAWMAAGGALLGMGLQILPHGPAFAGMTGMGIVWFLLKFLPKSWVKQLEERFDLPVSPKEAEAMNRKLGRRGESSPEAAPGAIIAAALRESLRLKEYAIEFVSPDEDASFGKILSDLSAAEHAALDQMSVELEDLKRSQQVTSRKSVQLENEYKQRRKILTDLNILRDDIDIPGGRQQYIFAVFAAWSNTEPRSLLGAIILTDLKEMQSDDFVLFDHQNSGIGTELWIAGFRHLIEQKRYRYFAEISPDHPGSLKALVKATKLFGVSLQPTGVKYAYVVELPHTIPPALDRRYRRTAGGQAPDDSGGRTDRSKDPGGLQSAALAAALIALAVGLPLVALAAAALWGWSYRRIMNRSYLGSDPRLKNNASVGTDPNLAQMAQPGGSLGSDPEESIEMRNPASPHAGGGLTKPISRRTVLGLGLSAAAASLLGTKVFAQASLSEKTVQAVFIALLADAPKGLAPLHELRFWQEKGLSVEDAKSALQIFESIFARTTRRLLEIKAPALSDEQMGLAMARRIRAELALIEIESNPNRGLEIFMTTFMDLLRDDLDFWALNPSKPEDLLIADLLGSALDHVPGVHLLDQAWKNLLDWVRPSRFTGRLNPQGRGPLDAFRAAALLSGYLIVDSVKDFPQAPNAHSIWFSIYYRRLDIPLENYQLGDASYPVAHFTALGESWPVKARTVYIKGFQPFIAVIQGNNALLAEYYADIRDGRRFNPTIVPPGFHNHPALRGFLQRLFPAGSFQAIEKVLDQAVLMHELVHMWSNEGFPRVRVRNYHYGLSDAEWKEFEKQSAFDGLHDPIRLESELTAYLGEVALSDQPLFTLLGLSGWIKNPRSNEVESIVYDDLLRAVAGQMIPLTQGRAQALSKALFEQQTPVTAMSIVDWLDALVQSGTRVDVLNDQIRSAARTVYSDLFITTKDQPAQLPQRPNVTALRRSEGMGTLAESRPATQDRRTALSRLLAPLKVGVASLAAVPPGSPKNLGSSPTNTPAPVAGQNNENNASVGTVPNARVNNPSPGGAAKWMGPRTPEDDHNITEVTVDRRGELVEAAADEKYGVKILRAKLPPRMDAAHIRLKEGPLLVVLHEDTPPEVEEALIFHEIREDYWETLKTPKGRRIFNQQQAHAIASAETAQSKTSRIPGMPEMRLSIYDEFQLERMKDDIGVMFAIVNENREDHHRWLTKAAKEQQERREELTKAVDEEPARGETPKLKVADAIQHEELIRRAVVDQIIDYYRERGPFEALPEREMPAGVKDAGYHVYIYGDPNTPEIPPLGFPVNYFVKKELYLSRSEYDRLKEQEQRTGKPALAARITRAAAESAAWIEEAGRRNKSLDEFWNWRRQEAYGVQVLQAIIDAQGAKVESDFLHGAAANPIRPDLKEIRFQAAMLRDREDDFLKAITAGEEDIHHGRFADAKSKFSRLRMIAKEEEQKLGEHLPLILHMYQMAEDLLTTISKLDDPESFRPWLPDPAGYIQIQQQSEMDPSSKHMPPKVEEPSYTVVRVRHTTRVGNTDKEVESILVLTRDDEGRYHLAGRISGELIENQDWIMGLQETFNGDRNLLPRTIHHLLKTRSISAWHWTPRTLDFEEHMMYRQMVRQYENELESRWRLGQWTIRLKAPSKPADQTKDPGLTQSAALAAVLVSLAVGLPLVALAAAAWWGWSYRRIINRLIFSKTDKTGLNLDGVIPSAKPTLFLIPHEHLHPRKAKIFWSVLEKVGNFDNAGFQRLIREMLADSRPLIESHRRESQQIQTLYNAHPMPIGFESSSEEAASTLDHGREFHSAVTALFQKKGIPDPQKAADEFVLLLLGPAVYLKATSLPQAELLPIEEASAWDQAHAALATAGHPSSEFAEANRQREEKIAENILAQQRSMILIIGSGHEAGIKAGLGERVSIVYPSSPREPKLADGGSPAGERPSQTLTTDFVYGLGDWAGISRRGTEKWVAPIVEAPMVAFVAAFSPLVPPLLDWFVSKHPGKNRERLVEGLRWVQGGMLLMAGLLLAGGLVMHFFHFQFAHFHVTQWTDWLRASMTFSATSIPGHAAWNWGNPDGSLTMGNTGGNFIGPDVSRYEELAWRQAIAEGSYGVKKENKDVVEWVEFRAMRLLQTRGAEIRKMLERQLFSAHKPENQMAEVLDALLHPSLSFDWFDAIVKGPDKYMVGNENALAVDMSQFLQDRRKHPRYDDLLEEYLLRAAIERTTLAPPKIVALTREFFHRGNENPLGDAIELFVSERPVPRQTSADDDMTFSSPRKSGKPNPYSTIHSIALIAGGMGVIAVLRYLGYLDNPVVQMAGILPIFGLRQLGELLHPDQDAEGPRLVQKQIETAERPESKTSPLLTLAITPSWNDDAELDAITEADARRLLDRSNQNALARDSDTPLAIITGLEPDALQSYLSRLKRDISQIAEETQGQRIEYLENEASGERADATPETDQRLPLGYRFIETYAAPDGAKPSVTLSIRIFQSASRKSVLKNSAVSILLALSLWGAPAPAQASLATHAAQTATAQQPSIEPSNQAQPPRSQRNNLSTRPDKPSYPTWLTVASVVGAISVIGLIAFGMGLLRRLSAQRWKWMQSDEPTLPKRPQPKKRGEPGEGGAVSSVQSIIERVLKYRQHQPAYNKGTLVPPFLFGSPIYLRDQDKPAGPLKVEALASVLNKILLAAVASSEEGPALRDSRIAILIQRQGDEAEIQITNTGISEAQDKKLDALNRFARFGLTLTREHSTKDTTVTLRFPVMPENSKGKDLASSPEMDPHRAEENARELWDSGHCIDALGNIRAAIAWWVRVHVLRQSVSRLKKVEQTRVRVQDALRALLNREDFDVRVMDPYVYGPESRPGRHAAVARVIKNPSSRRMIVEINPFASWKAIVRASIHEAEHLKRPKEMENPGEEEKVIAASYAALESFPQSLKDYQARKLRQTGEAVRAAQDAADPSVRDVINPILEHLGPLWDMRPVNRARAALINSKAAFSTAA